MDIDLARLKPTAVGIMLDGRSVNDLEIIKRMISLIAARKSWISTTTQSKLCHNHQTPVLQLRSNKTLQPQMRHQLSSLAHRPSLTIQPSSRFVRQYEISAKTAYTSICTYVTFDPMPNLKIFGKSTTRPTAKPLSRTRSSRTGGSLIDPAYMPCSFGLV